MAERGRQYILDPIIGEPDASSRSHDRLPDDPVPALEGDLRLDAVAIIRPAIPQNHRSSVMDHDLAYDPATPKLLPSEVKCLAYEGQVNVIGSRHCRVPRGDLPGREVGRGTLQTMAQNANTFGGSHINLVSWRGASILSNPHDVGLGQTFMLSAPNECPLTPPMQAFA